MINIGARLQVWEERLQPSIVSCRDDLTFDVSGVDIVAADCMLGMVRGKAVLRS